MSMQQLRQQSRRFYPGWTRHQRAKWVISAARAQRIGPRVPISNLNDADPKHYTFARTA